MNFLQANKTVLIAHEVLSITTNTSIAKEVNFCLRHLISTQFFFFFLIE